MGNVLAKGDSTPLNSTDCHSNSAISQRRGSGTDASEQLLKRTREEELSQDEDEEDEDKDKDKDDEDEGGLVDEGEGEDEEDEGGLVDEEGDDEGGEGGEEEDVEVKDKDEKDEKDEEQEEQVERDELEKKQQMVPVVPEMHQIVTSRRFRCFICSKGFHKKRQLWKHFATGYGWFGPGYRDHVDMLWAWPVKIPSPQNLSYEHSSRLHEQTVNFIQNMQLENRIRWKDGDVPETVTGSQPFFVGTAEEREEYEANISWPKNDQKNDWAQSSLPFSTVLLSDPLPTSYGAREGRRQTGGRIGGSPQSGSRQRENTRGRGAQDGHDADHRNYEDHDFDMGDPIQESEFVTQDTSQTQDAISDLVDRKHPSILLQVSENRWVAQRFDANNDDDDPKRGHFSRGFEVVHRLEHHSPSDPQSYICSCSTFSQNRQILGCQASPPIKESHPKIIRCVQVEAVAAVYKQQEQAASSSSDARNATIDMAYHPVGSDGIDYTGRDVVPLCMMEDSTVSFADSKESQGHPPAFSFLFQGSRNPSSVDCCVVVVQKHCNQHIVRCRSHQHHCGVKSDCCTSVRDVFNDKVHDMVSGDNSTAFAVLVGENSSKGPRAPKHHFQDEDFRQGEGFSSFKLPSSIFSQKAWWRRGSDSVQLDIVDTGGGDTVSGTAAEYPQKIIIFPKAAPSPDGVDTLEIEQVNFRAAVVFGPQFALPVDICDLKVTTRSSNGDPTCYIQRFKGTDLGLFRASKHEYYDAVTLLDDYLYQAFEGKMTMQSYHQRVKSEYSSFLEAQVPHDRRSKWIDFPSNRAFNIVLHHFKQSHEFNQEAFLQHVDICPVCLFCPGVNVFDGTFRFIKANYLQPEDASTYVDPSLEPNVGAWAGSLPRRRLQASLSSKDTSFSLLKAQPSQLKPVGGLQFEMMQAMLREHGIQDEVEDSAVPRAASKGTSVKRARQNTSQSTREGPKLYEWMGDKDIDKLRRMTGHGNNPFGEELSSVMYLFRDRSPLARKGSGLPELLRLLSHDVSVQAIVPWNIIPLIEDILKVEPHVETAEVGPPEIEAALRGIKDRLLPERMQVLSSIVGQPQITNLLGSLVDCLPKIQSDAAVAPQLIKDCNVVLTFLQYIIDCVKLSVPLDVRQRILESARADPKRPSKLRRCPNDHCPGPAACQECSYSREDFDIRGQHYPAMPVLVARGRYPKDKLAAEEKEEQQQSCDKDFEKGKPGHAVSGGLMATCCEHGYCYGFHMIFGSEGRNDVFTVLVERYEIPPLVIVYDFGCQLAEYCWNRWPEFFALTRFTIDRYHESNHSPQRCCRAFFLSSYPDQTGLNSQACEHFNSFLERYMKGRTELYNKQNFLNTVRMLARMYNAKKSANRNGAKFRL